MSSYKVSSSGPGAGCVLTSRGRLATVRGVHRAAAPRSLFHVLRFCAALILVPSMHAEEEAETHADVLVNAESDEAEHDQFTEMGEYGQPAWAERNRASSTTSVYVLSPYEAFFGLNWESDLHRHGKSIHDFTQEIDVGLLHRFELGFENELGFVESKAYETSATLEARYAFANWNAIPLNPAVSVEYTFGIGRSAPSIRNISPAGRPRWRDEPDAVTLRLLLGQALFQNRVGYGLNVGMAQDVTDDSGRRVEISQSLGYGLLAGEFEVGAEMRYTHSTAQSVTGHEDEFIIGPTFGWKPTRQTRLSFAPLFGCTRESPTTALFALFSYEFGGAEAVVPSGATHER